ncbi:MAG: transcriptional repressor [Thiotrichales bacterium]|nr:transcriptional repressor [Thiotrichales bacterium]
MTKLDKRLQQARITCQQQGQRLTPIREKVLRLLLMLDKPVSAYELLEHYKADEQSGTQPMTIYRALNFLESQSLIHRLASTRQYVACHHIHNEPHSELTQFLMCDHCGSIEETPLADSLWSAIQHNAEQTHFHIDQPSLEIHGTCQKCQTAI